MAGAAPGDGWDLNEDPRKAGVLNVAGDSAVVVARLIRLLADNHILPDDDAVNQEVNELTEASGRTITAAARLARVSGQQRKPEPMTPLPGEWGEHNLDHVRPNQITKFTGTSDDPTAVYTWLESCVALAEANGLTEEAFIGLMRITSDRSAATFLSNCRRMGQTAVQIVQELEIRYGDLCTPAEAIKRLSLVKRKWDTPVRILVDDLRRLARFATRDVEDEDIANDRVDEYIRVHLLRLVRTSIRKSLSQMMDMYLASNNRAMDITEMERIINKLEAEAAEEDAQKQGYKNKWQPAKANPQQKINQVDSNGLAEATAKLLSVTNAADDDSDSDDDAIQAVAEEPDAPDESDPILNFMIAAVKDVKTKARKPMDRQKLLSAAVKKYNRVIAGAQVSGANQGPPSKLDAGRKSTGGLLKDANVVKGECILCGLAGHYKGNVGCPLRGKKMVTHACTRCGKGLHDASDCITAHVDPRMVVNQVDEEDLNED